MNRYLSLRRAAISAGSVASLAVNVAVAQPRVAGWVIVARPFALMGSYELLMLQVRATACRLAASGV